MTGAPLTKTNPSKTTRSRGALFVTALAFFTSTQAQATLTDPACSIYLGAHQAIESASRMRAEFAVPNEINPVDAKKIVSKAIKGTYVVVGGERALFDYLLADDDKVQTLIAVDYDPGMIHFHALNSILARMAKDGDNDTYRKLRLFADANTWSQLAEKAYLAKRISSAEMMVITAPENIAWWKKLMSDSKWELFNTKPKTKEDAFYGVNYLHDADLFKRVQKLALSGRYKARLIDLSDEHEIRALTKLLNDLGQPLAFFDLSNAWQGDFPNDYLGEARTGKLLELLNEVAIDDSIAMVSFGKTAGTAMWFRAYTFGAFRKYTKTIYSWTKEPYTWSDAAYGFKSAFNDVVHAVIDHKPTERATLKKSF